MRTGLYRVKDDGLRKLADELQLSQNRLLYRRRVLHEILISLTVNIQL